MLAKVFKSGNSMAIRIPKAIKLDENTNFEIEKRDGQIILKPVKSHWQEFFEALNDFKEKIELPSDTLPQERNYGKILA